jgi:hypothetical protein
VSSQCKTTMARISLTRTSIVCLSMLALELRKLPTTSVKRSRSKRLKICADRCTKRDLRGRKGIDRWARYYIKIDFESQDPPLSTSTQTKRSMNDKILKTAIRLVKVIVCEFFKKHHLQPTLSDPARVSHCPHPEGSLNFRCLDYQHRRENLVSNER